MKKYGLYMLIPFIFILTFCGQDKIATVTFRVVDETGQPVPHVNMRAAYTGTDEQRGVTNASGEFQLTSQIGTLLVVICEKEGYHTTSGEVWSGALMIPERADARGIDYFPQRTKGGMVSIKPPETITIVLKRIINPIPMIHKRVETHVPVWDEPVGYDLVLGDWVAPHGDGKKADFIFAATAEVNHSSDYTSSMRISLNNPYDGIQMIMAPYPTPSNLASAQWVPQMAPKNGYNKAISMHREWVPDNYHNKSFDKDRHYIFRIRSQVNEKGEIIQAMYGMTLSDVTIGPRERTRDGRTIRNPEGMYITFTYYLNPDPDPENRSLEYNGENLLEGYDRRGFPE